MQSPSEDPRFQLWGPWVKTETNMTFVFCLIYFVTFHNIACQFNCVLKNPIYCINALNLKCTISLKETFYCQS